ncbi:MAG: DmsE family decaheme c-type cytochrome [Thermoanaerobaculia bacterium]
MPRRTLGTLLGGAVLLLLPLALSAQGQEKAGDTVGNETCITCHEDVGKRFAKNPHVLTGGKKPYKQNSAECESCHGPGAQHAENPTKENIVSFKSLKPLEASEKCLSCHRQDKTQIHWAGSAHAEGRAGCTSCHSMHGAAPSSKALLARPKATELCLTCHTNLARALNARSRHPLLEGKMDCASCHNPHGSVTESLVRRNSVNELCYTCHAEKRGPHLWEHSPVKENCLNCHNPHSSNFESLLVAQTSRLCQQCHMQGRHQTIPSKANEPWVFSRACMNCHPKIHGSNSPSGPIFQR